MTEAISFQSPSLVQARQSLDRGNHLVIVGLASISIGTGIFFGLHAWDNSRVIQWKRLPFFVVPCIATAAIMQYTTIQHRQCLKTHLPLVKEMFSDQKHWISIEQYLEHPHSKGILNAPLAPFASNLVMFLKAYNKWGADQQNATIKVKFESWLIKANVIALKRLKGEQVSQKYLDDWSHNATLVKLKYCH